MRFRTIVSTILLAVLLAVGAQAQTYTPLSMPKAQFFDANGNPLASGKVYTYAAGTSTPLDSYTDSTGGTPNANPVILDAGGFANIWLGTSAYKIVVKTSADVEVWTVDQVSGTVTTNIACTTCISDAEIDATGITTRTKLPTAIAYEDQSNTWTTGAQDMSAATTFKAPVTAAAAPTASGLLHYDSTANALEYGDNGTNRTVANLDETQTLSGKTFSDNLLWQSGTANVVTFDHAATTTRTVTFPDLTGTVAYLDNTQTFTGTKTFSAFPTISAGTATRVPFFGTAGLMDDDTGLVYDDTNNNLCAEQVDNVRHAACFSGADGGAKIIAALADLPSTGGVVTACGLEGSQTVSSTINITKRTKLLLCGATLTFTGTTAMFNITVQDVVIEGMSQSGNISALIYAGTAAVDIIKLSQVAALESYFQIKNVHIQFTADSASKGIYALNPLACNIDSVFIAHNTGVTQNRIVGIQLEVDTTGLVPTPGDCTIRNYYYTGNVSATLTGSKGLYLKGVAGAGGTLNHVVMEGYCNIEDAQYGIHLVKSSGFSLGGSCFLQGNGTNIKMEDSDNGIFSNVSMAAAVTEHVNIDASSFDNIFIQPNFFAPTTFGTNSGTRTINLNNPTGSWDFASVPLVTTGTVGTGALTATDLTVGSVATNAPVTISATPDADQGSLAIRPPNASKGYITFTETGVADRGAIGFDAGSANMLIKQTGAAGTSRVLVELTDGDIHTTGQVIIKKDSISAPTVAMELTGTPTAARTITFPDDTGTVPLLSRAQTFTAAQTLNAHVTVGSVATSAPLNVSATPNSTQGSLHLNPASGQKVYLAFTETSVADRGAIGYDAGSSTLKIRTGDATGTTLLQMDNAGSTLFTGRIVANTITTFGNGDVSPSVYLGNVFKTNNAGATTITTFDDGATGQEISILFTDANTTVSEAGNIRLSAAFTSTADDTMMLMFDGTNWFETSRSVN